MLHQCSCSGKPYPHFHCRNCDTPLQRKRAALQHSSKPICSRKYRQFQPDPSSLRPVLLLEATPHSNYVSLLNLKYKRAVGEIERLNQEVRQHKRPKKQQIIPIKEMLPQYRNKVITFPAAYSTIIFLQETKLSIRKAFQTLSAAQKGKMFTELTNLFSSTSNRIRSERAL